MSRKFSELTEDWSQKRQDRVAAKVSEMKGEMGLNELQQALELSQAESNPQPKSGHVQNSNKDNPA